MSGKALFGAGREIERGKLESFADKLKLRAMEVSRKGFLCQRGETKETGLAEKT